MAKDKINPFDYLNAINSGRDIISHAEDPLEAEAGYNPFLTNRGLSYHLDAVMAANEMNRFHHLDHKLQFLYHLYTLKPRKRIAKWIKPDISQDVEMIQSLYSINKRQAEIALSLLSDEQKQQLQEMYHIGEVRHEPSRRKIGRSKAS